MEDSFDRYGWTSEQRKRFRDFVEEKYANYANPSNTIWGYITVLNKIVKCIKKPFSEMTIDDLFPILQEWQENSPATVHGLRAKLRAFLRWESGDKHDPRAEKIRSSRYVSPVTLDDLLTEGEIEKLRQVAKRTPRDLAMLDFHLLWGPRPSESAKLNVGHVEVAKDRYIVVNIPETKTIARPVPIPLAKVSIIQDSTFLDSALNTYISLMKYLDSHEGFPHVPNAPLWYDLNNGHTKRLTPDGITAVFKRMGKAAGLKRSVTTYVLRRTAFNRFKGTDREKLCAGFGWKPHSRMPTTVYNKLRPQDVLGTLIKDEEKESRDILVCSKCQKESPKDQTFCVWCGAPLVELPASATLSQFHADQKTQKEFEEMKEKLGKIEKILGEMVELPGFSKLMEKAVKKRSM